jgi:glycosyltransferase involved in cell wall biosynthesis
VRVLYVSKASVVAAYRDKLHALAEHASVMAIVPERWGPVRALVDAPPAGAQSADDDGVRIRTARALLHGHNHLHVYRGARTLVRAAAPDIVHIDEEPYSAVTFQLALACRRAGVPFVFFAWQNLHKRLPPPFGMMRRYVFARAAAGIAGTRRAAAVLHNAGWHGETAVIPQLGVSPARFRPEPMQRVAVRRRLGMAADAFVAGFAGRLVPEKGVDLLLDAAASLDGAHVLVIGDGPERRSLADRAARLGIAERTHFVAAVASTAMPAWLNALDVLVLPSRSSRGWTEQFGRVLIEAMACRVPVAGAASGEIPTVIGDAGLLFDEGDVAQIRSHLERLRDSSTLRWTLGERGRARVLAEFTQERIARETAALYAAVLGLRTGAAAAPDTRAAANAARAGVSRP